MSFTDFERTLVRGGTHRIPFDVDTDITGWTLTFTLRRFLGDTSPALTLTIGSGITVTSASAGTLEVEIPAAFSSALVNRRQRFYAELRGVDGANKPWVLATGTVEVGAEVAAA